MGNTLNKDTDSKLLMKTLLELHHNSLMASNLIEEGKLHRHSNPHKLRNPDKISNLPNRCPPALATGNQLKNITNFFIKINILKTTHRKLMDLTEYTINRQSTSNSSDKNSSSTKSLTRLFKSLCLTPLMASSQCSQKNSSNPITTKLIRGKSTS